jgi:hypothetical protein
MMIDSLNMAVELAELRKKLTNLNLHITNKLKTTHAQLHITECTSILYDISANSDMSPTTTTVKKEINQGCKH